MADETMHSTSPGSSDPTSLSAFGPARSTVPGAPLTAQELDRLHAFWRACNYLALGMIYLRENPLLREPLRPEHVKNRLLGHWGASPALSFVYTHLNRIIREHDLDMIFMAGPGHGAPGVLGPVYLEGTYSEVYPDKSLDEEGLRRFFQQFSFPGGHRQPLHPGDSRLDPRGRRARLRALARVRRRLRQSRPDRRGRGRRRRVRDRPARDLLAREQVPQPAPRRRRAPGPVAERLQDQQPHPALAHLPRRAHQPASAATAGPRTSSKAPNRPGCTRRWRRPSTGASS